jgi:hypothetical protein
MEDGFFRVARHSMTFTIRATDTGRAPMLRADALQFSIFVRTRL